MDSQDARELTVVDRACFGSVSVFHHFLFGRSLGDDVFAGALGSAVDHDANDSAYSLYDRFSG